jgi:hypothetical protein
MDIARSEGSKKGDYPALDIKRKRWHKVIRQAGAVIILFCVVSIAALNGSDVALASIWPDEKAKCGFPNDLHSRVSHAATNIEYFYAIQHFLGNLNFPPINGIALQEDGWGNITDAGLINRSVCIRKDHACLDRLIGFSTHIILAEINAQDVEFASWNRREIIFNMLFEARRRTFTDVFKFESVTYGVADNERLLPVMINPNGSNPSALFLAHFSQSSTQNTPLSNADNCYNNSEQANKHGRICRTPLRSFGGGLLFIFGATLVKFALWITDEPRPDILQKWIAFAVWMLAIFCISHAIFLLLMGSWNPQSFLIC